MERKTEIAVFGGGCFWCTEAVFQELRGVISVIPGYAGGTKPNPTYEQVQSGGTGHAEVIKIEFDPAHITYNDLLTVFFAIHDPTTPNRQGDDRGTQYRSILLYTNERQKAQAEQFIEHLGAGIVTELKSLTQFYEAEDEHRQYYRNNLSQPYCQIVIHPKLEKVQKQFASLLQSHGKQP